MNNVNIGSGKIGGVYMGDDEVYKMYMGTDVVYELAFGTKRTTIVFNTTTPNETVFIGNIDGFSNAMMVDNVLTHVRETISFPTTGTHTVELDSTSTSIPSSAFSNSDAVVIILEDGVTDIGDFAFSGCSNLTYVTVPSSVTGCGQGAFASTPSLEHIYSDYVSDVYFVLGTTVYGAAEASVGTTMNVPYGVKRVEAYAFYGNTTVTTLNYPTTIEESGALVFSTANTITTINARSRFPNVGTFVYLQGGNLNIANCGCYTVSSDWITNGWTINLAQKFDDVTVNKTITTGGTTTAKTTTNTLAISNVDINDNDDRILVANVTYRITGNNDNLYYYHSMVFLDSSNNVIIENVDSNGFNVSATETLAVGSSTNRSFNSSKNHASCDITNNMGSGSIQFVMNHNSSSAYDDTISISI